MNHLSEENFKTIDCPLIKEYSKALNVTVFKYVNNGCPLYMKEVFEHASQVRTTLRNNCARLKVPFCKANMGKKSLSYIGPSVWKKLTNPMKINISLNVFKDDAKKLHLQELRM